MEEDNEHGSAPVGNNQHWKIVNSAQVAIDSSAEELWENAASYFLWCDSNPIISKRVINVGKEAGKNLNTEHARPYTVKGLCLHCGISEEYVSEIRHTKNKESEYYFIVQRIMYIIYTQNQEMATVGLFNPVFVARVLNMGEEVKEGGTIKIELVNGLPPLASSESEILKMLDSENKDNEKESL